MKKAMHIVIQYTLNMLSVLYVDIATHGNDTRVITGMDRLGYAAYSSVKTIGGSVHSVDNKYCDKR